MDSSATESPLDVLSRAATMVQDNTFNTLPPSYEEAQQYLKCKDIAVQGIGGVTGTTGGKINSKRLQRRLRTATGGSVVAITALPGHNIATTTTTTTIITATTTTHNNNNLVHHPEPLDMSMTKKIRGSPPSYQQSVQYIQLSAAANAVGRPHRPSVITSCTGTLNSSCNTNDISDEGGVCDSVIEEHFRRSLGKDYLSLFSSNNHRNNSRVNGSEEDVVSSDTGSALSVDDHFAKALGDTWLKLQQRETKDKNKKNENDSVTTTTSLSSTTAEQVQDVSTSDNEISSNKTTEEQKSLTRHDRRLL